MPHTTKSPEMQECIDNCLECYSICLETIEHCLGLGGEQAAPDHIRILTDCAATCQSSANFMLRDSQLHPRVCEVCAEACERCAEACERFDDEMMKECAEVCRRCAESCRQMASMKMAA